MEWIDRPQITGDQPNERGDRDVQLKAVVETGAPDVRDQERIKVGPQLLRAVDPVEEPQGKLWALTSTGAVFDFLDGRVELKEPALTAMIVAAVGLHLFARVRRV